MNVCYNFSMYLNSLESCIMTLSVHYDNAPCRTNILMNEFLTSQNTSVAPKLLFSPDLNFPFSSKLKNLKKRHFGTLESIKKGCN